MFQADLRRFTQIYSAGYRRTEFIILEPAINKKVDYAQHFTEYPKDNGSAAA